MYRTTKEMQTLNSLKCMVLLTVIVLCLNRDKCSQLKGNDDGSIVSMHLISV